MITVERRTKIAVYRVRCDGCRQATYDGYPRASLRDFWYHCMAKGWELPPPYPCERLWEIKQRPALCPACVKKGLVISAFSG